MRKIEVVEPNGFMDGKVKRDFGDKFNPVVTPDDYGMFDDDVIKTQHFINLGWAKCCESGECGERIEGVSKIKPDNVIQDPVL